MIANILPIQSAKAYLFSIFLAEYIMAVFLSRIHVPVCITYGIKQKRYYLSNYNTHENYRSVKVLTQSATQKKELWESQRLKVVGEKVKNTYAELPWKMLSKLVLWLICTSARQVTGCLKIIFKSCSDKKCRKVSLTVTIAAHCDKREWSGTKSHSCYGFHGGPQCIKI